MHEPRTRVDRVLNVAAGISILIAILAVTLFTFSDRPRSAYDVGDRFDELPELSLQNAPATLLMFVNSACGPCNDSVPLYRRLLTANRSAKVVAIGRESEEQLSLLFAGTGARPDAIMSIGNRPTRLQFTPTLILVRADRRVAAVWIGKLQSLDEETGLLQRLR